MYSASSRSFSVLSLSDCATLPELFLTVPYNPRTIRHGASVCGTAHPRDRPRPSQAHRTSCPSPGCKSSTSQPPRAPICAPRILPICSLQFRRVLREPNSILQIIANLPRGAGPCRSCTGRRSCKGRGSLPAVVSTAYSRQWLTFAVGAACRCACLPSYDHRDCDALFACDNDGRNTRLQRLRERHDRRMACERGLRRY